MSFTKTGIQWTTGYIWKGSIYKKKTWDPHDLGLKGRLPEFIKNFLLNRTLIKNIIPKKKL